MALTRRDRPLAVLPISPQMLGEANVSAPLATFSASAMVDPERPAGRVQHAFRFHRSTAATCCAACCRGRSARMFDQIRPYGFIAALRADPDRRVRRARRTRRTDSILFWLPTPVTSKPRVVSGMRPTGRLHLGHLVGALGNWVRCRTSTTAFYFVADWHALTSDFADTEPADVDMPTTTSPTGSAPGSILRSSTFFVQSLVPEHAELYLLLSMVVPVPWLERVPTYKEQQENLKDKRSVVDRLPRLSAAADRRRRDVRRAVRPGRRRPGGAPRAVAREAVRRFNNFFGDVLGRAAAAADDGSAVCPGLDGDKKMSKSLGNTIRPRPTRRTR